MSAPPFKLRPYADGDEDAAIELWRRSWQEAYPAIDFRQRVDWWRERWRQELIPQAHIVIAESDAGLIGYVAMLWRSRREPDKLIAWAAVALLAAIAAGLLCWQTRAGPAAQLLSIPGATALAWLIVTSDLFS